MQKSLTKLPPRSKVNGKSIPTLSPEDVPLDPLFSPKEWKLLKRRLSLRPFEYEILFAPMTLVSNKAILWYKEQEGDRDTYPVCLQVYSFREKRWKEDCLNSHSFFALCEYNGLLWRCKDFKEVALLQKALKKYLKMKQPEMLWED